MKTDGGLRTLFRQHLPELDLQAIETWSTGQGVPDMNFCCKGKEGWIEFKKTQASFVEVKPEQVAWIERRLRHGGRVFVSVRLLSFSGPRKEARDELFLLKGWAIRNLKVGGLKSVKKGDILVHSSGGPASWDWQAVNNSLTA